jgi:catechol 2,3-dioxygenase-like lactoylglutathione lyase family enzyme
MENPSILSHVSVGTNDYERAKDFYNELLSSVGFKIIEDLAEYKWVSFGKQYPEFWVGEPMNGEPATPGNGVHVSFLVDTDELVDVFYQKALELGAEDNGAPGPREHYGKGYYGAFVIDSDGNKIEAMHWTENID